jgi:transposase
MMSRANGVQLSLFTTTLDEVVPSDHFLRKLDAMVDFSFIYNELAPYYCKDNGRPSTDPVVIVKSLLIGFLYGINSERRLEQELRYNVAYRWFLRLGFDESIPDHSTISQLRRRKFDDADLFRKLFIHVVRLCAENGLINGKLLITDSTHVKANAAKMSKVAVQIEKDTAEFFELLDAYEAEERKRLELPEISRKPIEPKTTTQTKSITDPESGWLNRPGKPEGFHYLSHQTLDAENGIIVAVETTAGNTSDNTPYLAQMDDAIQTLGAFDVQVQTVSADSSYDTAIIHKGLKERSITPYIRRTKIADRTKVEYKRDDFKYNHENDTFICPMGSILPLRCLQRYESGIFKEYRAGSKTCKDCPNRLKCLSPSQTSRKLQVNIFQGIVDEHHLADETILYNYALKKRQIWCEGTFAMQKSRHNMSRLNRRGLKAAKDHSLLSAAAVNLKRMVKCLG